MFLCFNRRIENSPLWNPAQPKLNDRSCLIFEDQNVLLEGVSQACLLTKTLQVGEDLPQKVENLVTDIPGNINRLITRYINRMTILFIVFSLNVLLQENIF